MPTRPLVGLIADYWLGSINTFIVSAAFLGATLFVWTGVYTRPAMYGFAVLFGLANGAAQGIWIGSLSTLTPDARKMGVRFGMICTLTAFATLAGPPTASAIIQGSGGVYTWAQVWAGTVILLGTVAVVASRVHMVGWKLGAKV